LKERTGVDARVLEGDKSQFDVLVDGALVWSKQREGRFPEPDDIVGALA
jgi:selT/selW/selH-like putative selenoprotein